MAGVVDVEAEGEPALLTSTGSGGLLGGEYLHDRPLADHLQSYEAVRYVMENKRAGLTIERDGTETTLEPGDDYRTLAAVTDLRVLFVAGKPGGDEAASVRLREVDRAAAESAGLRTTTLELEAGGASYRFPCRGDLASVATYVEETADAWRRADRRLDEAAATLDESRAHLDDEEYDAALARLDDLVDRLEATADTVRDIGPAAVESLGGRVETLADELRWLRRPAAAARAARRHADAQAAWAAREYERALAAYDGAVADYDTALGVAGDEPPTASLRARVAGAVRERAVLRAAPLADAETARRRATERDDPAAAARGYDETLERYRVALELADGGFTVEAASVREHAETVATAAIDAHRAAARRAERAADHLAVRGDDAADPAYERARDHVTRAHRLAREVDPEAAESLAATRDRLDDRLAGRGRPEPESAVAEGADDGETGRTAGSSGDGSRAGREVVGAGAGETGGLTAGADPADGTEPSTAAILSEVRGLDGRDLTELVADAWAATGWSTTVFGAAGAAVYDVVAVRDGGDRRLLLWTDHDPDGGPGPRDVERVATARDSGGGEVDATLVTTGTPSAAARQRAGELGVRLVAGEELAERLREAGLLDRLSP